jgi:TPR repeat protein
MVNHLLRAALLVACCSALAAQQSEADRTLFKQTKAKADKGDAAAQLQLGNFYFYGTGVSKDLSKGVKWHRKAAEQGLAMAQYQLALDYALGEGAEPDKPEAAIWFRKAAEQNVVEAQVEIGQCYARGDGVQANGADAIHWFRKAVAQGSMDAEYQIGKCYFEGTGFSKDIEQGVKWIRHAAERGFAPAQNAFGQCYEKGTGVPKDPLQAYKWFALAAARDDEHAVDIRVNLAKMEALLKPEEVAEAQRLAREFKPVNQPLPDAATDATTAQTSAASTGPSETAQPGFVNVTANDESSEIFADGAFMGNSPAKLKLKDGPHVIEVKRAGFKSYRREITVSAGSDLNLRVTLEKE